MANSFNLGNGNWAQKTEKLLAYNAENDNYKPLPFDFDRASTATRVNKEGLIETVATDEPRIDFLNNSKGHLLLEPQRTNLVTYSEDLSQWVASSGIQLTSGQLGVGNSNDAWKIQRSLAYDNIRSIISFTSTSTVSVYAKKGSYNFLRIAISGIAEQCYFDLENGVIGTTTNLISSDIKYINNDWYRCSMTFNNSSGTGVYIQPVETDGGIGNSGTGHIFVQYPQTEEGSYATSYIPTSGQSGGVTRSAETCNNAGNSTVFNDSEGVLYVEALLKDTGTFKTVARITATDTSTSDGLWIYFRSDNKIQSVLRVGGVDQTSILSNTQTTNEYYKVAFKYKQNDFALWVNGTEVAPDTSGNTFSADTLSKLGFILSTDINPFIGNVKDVRVYNTALTDAELIALTS